MMLPRVNKSVVVQVLCGSARCNGVMDGTEDGGIGSFFGGDDYLGSSIRTPFVIYTGVFRI